MGLVFIVPLAVGSCVAKYGLCLPSNGTFVMYVLYISSSHVTRLLVSSLRVVCPGYTALRVRWLLVAGYFSYSKAWFDT